MNNLWQDLRYAARMLLKKPGFTLIAVITLAVGIGANTAIFSLLNEALLRPLPVHEPERLVGLYRKIPQDENFNRFSYPNYIDTRERSSSFSGLAAYFFTALNLSNNGQTERAAGKIVTANYFDVLGVKMAVGRAFLPEDDKTPGGHPVAVISNGLWQRSFAADPEFIGRGITINGHQFTVIGIAPEDFRGTELGMAPDVYVPIMMQQQAMNGDDWLRSRMIGWLRVVGRLSSGVTSDQAQAELEAIGNQLRQEHPKENEAFGIAVVPDFGLHPNFRGDAERFLLLLLAVVGLVLLIACANIAGLLLARAAERRREIGIRMALGARRLRLARQMLTESLLLSLLGGAAGLLLTLWFSSLIEAALRAGQVLPSPIEFGLDHRVLIFTLSISVLSGLIFGMVPAINAMKTDLAGIIKDASGTLQGKLRMRHIFVITQIALSLVLLTAAGLFVRSLLRAQQIDPGFNSENVLMMSLDLGLQGYKPEQARSFQRQLEQQLAALPGVQQVALAGQAPLTSDADTTIEVEGYKPPTGLSGVVINFNVVGANYFQTLGIPLVQGRAFTEQDEQRDARGVAIINETAARRFWAEESAVGKRISMGKSALEIVGIARDGKYVTLGEDPRSYLYLPVSGNGLSGITVLLRTGGEPMNVITPVRQTVQSLDQNLPVYDIRTMNQHLSGALFGARLSAVLLGLFGGVALLLAALGIYGVMAYAVSQRTREIGIRMALGAKADDVMKLIVRRGMKLTIIGIVPGLIAALLVTRLLKGFLYEVGANDPVTFVVIVALLASVAFLACWIPARRAMKVNPIEALRCE